jgi:hypothetical protein
MDPGTMHEITIDFINGKYIHWKCNLSREVVQTLVLFWADHGDDSTASMHFTSALDIDVRELGLLERSGFINGGRALLMHRSEVKSIEIVYPTHLKGETP